MSIEAANAETTRIVIAENIELRTAIFELEKQLRHFIAVEEMRRDAEK